MLRKHFIFLFFLLVSFQVYGQVNGFIIDEDKFGMPGCYIQLLPDGLLTVSEQDGYFSYTDLPDGEYALIISYVGYSADTVSTIVKNGKADRINIQLKPASTILQTVEVIEEHAKQEATLNTEHIHQDFFEKNIEGTFAKSIEKIPGISAINVGVGIAKPVIRGLSANRIIVNHQGIKQESQQWGSDHGLEIDPFDVDQVEIIKGPGSLQYGSDGLGGVINIMPSKLLPKNTFKGSVIGVHKTNNDHWGGSAQLAVNLNDWFVSSRYSRQSFADYRVPASFFNYNDFELPIFDERLKNTAGEESNLSISTGVSRSWGITRLLYSHYSLEAGLFSGAVGIPRSYALVHDGNYRDIDVPSQKVDHYRASLNQTFIFDHNHLVFDFGFQRNLRREFAEPESHNIPDSQLLDLNDKLGIELELRTYSMATHFEHHFHPDWTNTYGANVQWQNNQRGGFDYLLPDFRTFRGGVFYISEWEPQQNWLINGGLRFDLGTNNSEFFQRYIWDSNENIIDSLSSSMTDDQFFNWSASLGGNLKLNDGKWLLKANFGKSFRVPYPAETVSNGIHHGTFRHEIGTPDLQSEHGYQFDLSAELNLTNFSGSLSSYFNYFDNYIYLGPTFPARFSMLPEAGQIFQYRQDDAIYTGFELQWTWDFLNHLTAQQAIDFVQSYNPKTRLALPFTPQPSIRTDLKYNLESFKRLKDFYFEINHQYHFAASGPSRIDRSEKATPAYQLLGLGLGSKSQLGAQSISINCQVKNIFNTFYLSHLSRYRLIDIPEQGRNFVLTLKMDIGGKFN